MKIHLLINFSLIIFVAAAYIMVRTAIYFKKSPVLCLASVAGAVAVSAFGVYSWYCLYDLHGINVLMELGLPCK